jgi:hypothetical protein
MKQMCIILSLLCAVITAQNLKLGGYCENNTSYTFADTGFFSDHALLRLEAESKGDGYAVEAHCIFKAAYQPLDPVVGLKKDSKMAGIFNDLVDGYLEAFEEDTLLDLSFLEESNALRYLPYASFYPAETFTLDRALIRLSTKRADFYFGRQQIAWGTGYGFNPTDIWNQKNPLDVSAPKLGVNAVRIQVPLGSLSHVDLVGVPGADIRHSSAGLRAKTNIKGFDVSFSASKYNNADRAILGLPERVLGGADMAGQIGEVGVWTEAVFINPKHKGMGYSDFDSAYVQADAGIDYTFDNGLYCMAEYYYNGLGESTASGYGPAGIIYQYVGDMAGLAQNYLMAGARRNVLDKIDLSLFAFGNLNDVSAIWMPGIDYSFGDNVVLNLKAALASGNKKATELGSLEHSLSLKVTGYF